MKSKLITLIFIISLFFTMTPSYAGFLDRLSGRDVVQGEEIEQIITTNVGTLYKTIQITGIVVAVAITAVAGVQWITATPNKKAELKSKMFAIVVGVCLILLATTIVRFIGEFWQSNL